MCPEGQHSQTPGLFVSRDARKSPENRIDVELLQRHPVASMHDRHFFTRWGGRAQERAARESCRETGSKEKGKKIDANDG